MSTAETLHIVTSWFDQVSRANLQLPDRWIRGPGRSLHRLTRAEARSDQMLIELDGQLLLVLTAHMERIVSQEELVNDDFCRPQPGSL